MSNKQFVGLRRSDSPELVPQEENIELGELAFNTADGKVYFKMLDGTIVELTDKFTKEEVQGIIDGLTTDDIAEADNLYFTQERTRGSLSAGGDLSYNQSTGEFSVTTYKSADFDNDFSSKSTTDLSEGSNLYFTEQRARDSISVSGDLKYTDGVISFNETYSTPEEVKQAYESNANTNAFTDDEKGKLDGIEAGAEVNTVTSVAGRDGDVTLDTDDVSEAGNLYFTEERVRQSISVDGDLSYEDGVIGFNETYSNPSDIKQAYESNSDTNAFTDSDKDKLEEVGSMAKREVFIENSSPDNSIGENGDVWFQF